MKTIGKVCNMYVALETRCTATSILSLFVVVLWFQPLPIDGHGRLIEPPSRASAWRYGFDTPHNYNDHESYCGGFSRQWLKNGGKCGVCGDPWDSKTPRAHEFGGTYGQGVVVRKYGVGAAITIRVELTANHHGYFTFALCPDYKTATQDCLDRNVLTLVKPQDSVDPNGGTRYYPKEGNRVYEMKYRLPKKSCEHCLLQWRYIAGNNWGNCPNGTGAVGCGPQEEFRACSDITIKGKAGDYDEPMVPEQGSAGVVHPTVTDVPTDVVPTAEESWSPITALILSLMSFLIVFLVFSLLYIHFYQVGSKVKGWLKGENPTEDRIKHGNVRIEEPLPPPRTKRHFRHDFP